MSIRVGVTGGIGSGKSVVIRLLDTMGVPVYIADIESKKLTVNNDEIRKGLCELLGDNVYQDGKLNKPLLASYLFASRENATKVESIIHPVVRKHFEQWCLEHSNAPIVAMESAILLETQFIDTVDVVVVVSAPVDIRLKRAMLRDGATKEQIVARMAAQSSDEQKSRLADFTIINDGKTPIIPQVLELFTFLSENNVYLCHAKK